MNECQENRPNVSEDQKKKPTSRFISSSRSLTSSLRNYSLSIFYVQFYFLLSIFFIFYHYYLLLFLTAFLKAQTYIKAITILFKTEYIPDGGKPNSGIPNGGILDGRKTVWQNNRF